MDPAISRHSKARCNCLICRCRQEPVDCRTVRLHRQRYGVYDETEVQEESESPYTSPVRSSSPPSTSSMRPDFHLIQSTINIPVEDDNSIFSVDLEEASNTVISDSSEDDNLVDLDSGDDSFSDSEILDNVDNDWNFTYNKELYNTGIAVHIIPGTDLTILQWLALNFHLFTSHPSISKSAFSNYLQLQNICQDSELHLPSSYTDARKMISSFVTKTLKFDCCVKDCILFRQNDQNSYGDLDKCPVCEENGYVKTCSKYSTPRRTFRYIPLGPRLARIYGEHNLVKLVQSHPGNTYTGDDMWDIHHSPIWKDVYSKHGYFSGDKLGLSFAFEMDGVNPFHNIGVMYSMTPMMLTLLNLPRNIRNLFGNMFLVGIIPGSGRSESSNIEPFVEVLIDEILYLTQCETYNSYSKAPVTVKIKLLLYILDYPGLSKLFNQIGSGGLAGCHWCLLRGERCTHLDKVIYLSNRSFLEMDDLLRKDSSKYVKKEPDFSTKPPIRDVENEKIYRQAYDKAQNKTQAGIVACATGCKSQYILSKLPGHNRIEESLPDSCHTIKDVIQTVMNLITGRNVDFSKIIGVEMKLDRMHVVSMDSSSVVKLDGWEGVEVASIPTKNSRKRRCNTISSSAHGKNNSKKKRISSVNSGDLPFALTKADIEVADDRAKSICFPLGFGLKQTGFISKPGSLKLHDWKQLATEGILKFCLRGMLSNQCRESLFFLLDSITEICKESQNEDDIDRVEINLNRALALLERDFPVLLHNITTHLLHHIPDGIRRYGPVYVHGCMFSSVLIHGCVSAFLT